jgi:hypothetical protein
MSNPVLIPASFLGLTGSYAGDQRGARQQHWQCRAPFAAALGKRGLREHLSALGLLGPPQVECGGAEAGTSRSLPTATRTKITERPVTLEFQEHCVNYPAVLSHRIELR